MLIRLCFVFLCSRSQENLWDWKRKLRNKGRYNSKSADEKWPGNSVHSNREGKFMQRCDSETALLENKL